MPRRRAFLGAGTIVGSGTVANKDHSRRLLLHRRAPHAGDSWSGEPRTPFMKFGDRVRIEMFDRKARSIFGAIDQEVVRYAGA